jgi:hypothetical protein
MIANHTNSVTVSDINMAGFDTPDDFEPPGIGNEARLYYWLYKVAMARYDSDLPGDLERAFEDCERLRLIPNLPLMVLARIHMLLSTKNNADGT